MGTERETEKHEVRTIVKSVFSDVSGHDVPKLWRLCLEGKSLQDDTAFNSRARCQREGNSQSQALLWEVKNAKCQVPLLSPRGAGRLSND